MQGLLDSPINHAIVVTALDGKVLLWNQGAVRIFGYAPAEIIGSDVEILFVPNDRKNRVPAKEMERALRHGCSSNFRWHLRNDGTTFWGDGMTYPVRVDGAHIGYITLLRDATQEKLREDEHTRLAFTDALTGLPNRAELLRRMVDMLGSAQRHDELLVFHLIDLDNFKDVNDTLGHQAGDELLVELTQRMSAQLRTTDLLARLAGDHVRPRPTDRARYRRQPGGGRETAGRTRAPGRHRRQHGQRLRQHRHQHLPRRRHRHRATHRQRRQRAVQGQGRWTRAVLRVRGDGKRVRPWAEEWRGRDGWDVAGPRSRPRFIRPECTPACARARVPRGASSNNSPGGCEPLWPSIQTRGVSSIERRTASHVAEMPRTPCEGLGARSDPSRQGFNQMGETDRLEAVFVAGNKHGHRETRGNAPDVLHVFDAGGGPMVYVKRNTLRGGTADPTSTYVFYAPSGLPQREYSQLLKDARRLAISAGAHARFAMFLSQPAGAVHPDQESNTSKRAPGPKGRERTLGAGRGRQPPQPPQHSEGMRSTCVGTTGQPASNRTPSNAASDSIVAIRSARPPAARSTSAAGSSRVSAASMDATRDGASGRESRIA